MMFQYKVLKFLPIKSIATIYIRKSENSLLLDFIFINTSVKIYRAKS